MSKATQNKGNKNNAQTANASVTDATTQAPATTNSDAVNVEGLETAPAANLTKHVADEASVSKFKDIEFLQKENPADYHTDENISSKYNKEREDKVFAGFNLLPGIKLSNGSEVNPLLILLGKWWEVKPARAGIKSLIDDEAKTKGYTSDVYMQVVLKEQIDELSEIQTAVDRARYSITYFKPRKPLSNTVIMEQIRIDNKFYSVSKIALNEAKEKFGTDKEALRAHILTIAIPSDVVEEL